MNISKNKHQDNIISICCGLVIRKIRKSHGVSANELAIRVNLSQQQISRYERGKNKISIDMLFNISVALNYPFEKIIRLVICEVQKTPSDDLITLKNKIFASESIYFY